MAQIIVTRAHTDSRISYSGFLVVLEEDNDDIPLIEYEFSKDGKHGPASAHERQPCRFLKRLCARSYMPTEKEELTKGNT